MDSKFITKLPLLLFFFFISLFSEAFAYQPSYHFPASAPGPTPDPSEFILSNCNATLYSSLCITSLSRYATYIHHNPAHLARIAIGVSLVRAQHVLAGISNITSQADLGFDQQATSAVHDCATLLGQTVDQMRVSLKEMSQLGASGGAGVSFHISNVQTWMSAALTNEETCSDGFQAVSDECAVKAEVCDKVGSVKEYTSNALALVNSFAATVGP
ncbi:hypothetical protein vseg_004781 [Gypsophila vaccaria]